MESGENRYLWQADDWPRWRYDLAALTDPLTDVSRAQGLLLGRLADLGIALRDQASLAALTEDVVKTTEIEGERLDVQSVRSSIARRMGVDIGALTPVDRHVEGVVEMVLDATTRAAEALTAERLFGWHAALFPTGWTGMKRERKDYYEVLERTQKGTLDVTGWLSWFLGTLGRAVASSQTTLNAVLAKARFWQRWAGLPLNARQVKLLNRLLDGFDGKLTTSKWAAIAKCSPDTALRDITELLALEVLRKTPGGGRSTGYELTD